MSAPTDLQKWFAELITQPLQPNNSIAEITPFGTAIQGEASKYIAPSPTLEPYQRLELYHQQYWWRLLKTLQENFPFLARLYGHENFNQKVAIPYLSENKPDHWALCKLGQSLPDWLCKKGFEAIDCDAAEIDAAAQRAFWAFQNEPVDFSLLSEEEILHCTLALQLHVHLFVLGGDLFAFREALLNEEKAPELKKGKHFFALYRNPKNQVRWKELSEGEYTFLTYFQGGKTIQQVCDLCEKKGGALFQEAEERLPLWFREWTFLHWFWQV